MKSKDGSTLRAFRFRINGGNPQTVAVIRELPWGKWYALGHQFGPVLFVKCDGEAAALDIFDEHFGERVDPSDPALLDYYDGPKLKSKRARMVAAWSAALDSGDIRINDGGTVVWSDPYEFLREIRRKPKASRV